MEGVSVRCRLSRVMVASRWPLFINATAICMAIVVFPEPPFSFPTTMTWGDPREFTATFSMAAPRNNRFHDGNAAAARQFVQARSRHRQLIERTSRGRDLFLPVECDQGRYARRGSVARRQCPCRTFSRTGLLAHRRAPPEET